MHARQSLVSELYPPALGTSIITQHGKWYKGLYDVIRIKKREKRFISKLKEECGQTCLEESEGGM